MSEECKTEIAIVEALSPREIHLVHALVVIASNPDLSSKQRQIAAMLAVCDMASDIPVLNADGALVQPLYAIRDELRGQIISGGKRHSDYAMEIYAVAFVNVLKSDGVLFDDAYNEASTLMTSYGRAVAGTTIKDWRVGAKDRAFIEAVRAIEVIIKTSIPLTSKDMSRLQDRARHWFEEQCKVNAKFD